VAAGERAGQEPLRLCRIGSDDPEDQQRRWRDRFERGAPLGPRSIDAVLAVQVEQIEEERGQQQVADRLDHLLHAAGDVVQPAGEDTNLVTGAMHLHSNTLEQPGDR